MRLVRDVWDGVIRKRTFAEGDQLTVVSSQPTRNAILSDNAEIRKNADNLRDMDAMEWALQIPEDDYNTLIKCNPSLTHPDAVTRTAAWKAFINGPESLPYRVRHQKWRSQ
jgi:hypothetical protein